MIWGWLQIVESVVQEEKVCVCGLLLSPAESAKQAINKSNLIWNNVSWPYQSHISCNSAQPEDVQRLREDEDEDVRRSIQRRNWLHASIVVAQICGFWHICKA